MKVFCCCCLFVFGRCPLGVGALCTLCVQGALVLALALALALALVLALALALALTNTLHF